MRIGLAGYYGFNAYSDELVAMAIQSAFPQDTEWRILPLGVGRIDDLDLIVLGGGSLLGHPLPDLVANLKKFEGPFAILGTGFRNLESSENLRFLWDAADIVTVRGHHTLSQLETLKLDVDRVSALGDPIFLLSPDPVVKKVQLGAVIRPHEQSNDRQLYELLKYLEGKVKLDYSLFSFSEAQGDWGTRGSLKDAYDHIRQSLFWFGNRLHPLCVALINDIPAIGVEVEFNKMRDALSPIHYPFFFELSDPLAAKPREEDFAKIDEFYEKLMAEGGEARKKMRRSIEKVRGNLMRAVAHVVNLV